MKILIIDNYDSFTFNLYQYIGEILEAKQDSYSITVVRNDKVTIGQINQSFYDKIVLSPGPGNPTDPHYFGVCADVITTLTQTTPVFGVCLGMQGIASCFGASIIKARQPMHGKTSEVTHDGSGVFAGLAQNISVMRYHSLIVDPKSVPSCFIVTARATDTGEIMGLRHTSLALEGVQFHPESFATEAGQTMLGNFLLKE